MSSRSDVSEFLKTRRARITPDQARVREYGRARRVPGLKREEVAMLAGVSTEYYARLERGDMRGVSDSVLNALARALQLDDAEPVHLFDLARITTSAEPASSRVTRPTVRPSIVRLLDTMSATPAYVRNARFGDNIYHLNADGSWAQENSHHSFHNGGANPENVIRDTGLTACSFPISSPTGVAKGRRSPHGSGTPMA